MSFFGWLRKKPQETRQTEADESVQKKEEEVVASPPSEVSKRVPVSRPSLSVRSKRASRWLSFGGPTKKVKRLSAPHDAFVWAFVNPQKPQRININTVRLNTVRPNTVQFRLPSFNPVRMTSPKIRTINISKVRL